MKFFLSWIVSDQSIGNLHLYYLMVLSAYLGFMPSGTFSPQTPFFDLKEGYFVSAIPDHNHYLDELKSKAISDLLDLEINRCHVIKFNRNLRQELLACILDFYKLHIENLPEINAHKILQEVLDG